MKHFVLRDFIPILRCQLFLLLISLAAFHFCSENGFAAKMLDRPTGELKSEPSKNPILSEIFAKKSNPTNVGDKTTTNNKYIVILSLVERSEFL
ncbi:MAG: hypothetical protein IPJ71_01125 [Bdellovibrionales bacterium]|nr:hypothetical protein [Bdellovibrionales bacterium]